MSEPERIPKLLLVDDEPQILSALRRTLRRERYEVFTAETPAEALRLLEAEPIDLVLSDQMMPGTTGLQLLARARQLRPHAVCMLITGWMQEIPQEAIRAAGVRAVVPKPWSDEALKETLRIASKQLIC